MWGARCIVGVIKIKSLIVSLSVSLVSLLVEFLYCVVETIDEPALVVVGAATGSLPLRDRPRGSPRPPLLKGVLPLCLQRVVIHASGMLLSYMVWMF